VASLRADEESAGVEGEARPLGHLHAFGGPHTLAIVFPRAQPHGARASPTRTINAMPL
jgi:hypothetical protein